jgi:hypothetical protein
MYTVRNKRVFLSKNPPGGGFDVSLLPETISTLKRVLTVWMRLKG